MDVKALLTSSLLLETVIRYNDPIAQYYKRVKKRTGSGKEAQKSTMHKLVMMIYHMLSKREAWTYAEEQLTEIANELNCLS